jgi:hypothetical protein
VEAQAERAVRVLTTAARRREVTESNRGCPQPAEWLPDGPGRAPFELIARQLGHRDVAMVYGRFKPDTEERDRWERIAETRDIEK